MGEYGGLRAYSARTSAVAISREDKDKAKAAEHLQSTQTLLHSRLLRISSIESQQSAGMRESDRSPRFL